MKKVFWKWNLVGCRKSGASRLPGTHSNLAIARYLSFQQSIRQPRRPHSRGPGSGAGARSFPFRCSVFVWPSSPSDFFWPSLLLPAWPVMRVISSFFSAQFTLMRMILCVKNYHLFWFFSTYLYMILFTSATTLFWYH